MYLKHLDKMLSHMRTAFKTAPIASQEATLKYNPQCSVQINQGTMKLISKQFATQFLSSLSDNYSEFPVQCNIR